MDIPRLRGDKGQLREALRNLLLNAIEATGQGRVTVRVEATPADEVPCIRVLIEDEGPGLTPEALERFQRPFATTKPGGTGLGLSVSYNIVKEHGGSLEFSSTPGAGTCAVVELPAFHD